MTYGERLRAARLKKGLSQQELARLAGVKQQLISYLENPRNRQQVSGSQVTASLAAACGVDPLWLEKGNGEEPREAKSVVNEAGARYSVTPEAEALAQAIQALRPDVRAAMRTIVAAIAPRPHGPREHRLPSSVVEPHSTSHASARKRPRAA